MLNHTSRLCSPLSVGLSPVLKNMTTLNDGDKNSFFFLSCLFSLDVLEDMGEPPVKDDGVVASFFL